ncbi:MAG TPA: glycosyltransferase family 87 protein [Kiritimatiellia bacterium]|nr:glycosyltransferase family 87 protein [Kiritimatiellia bacterium]HPS06941.1 glycosyltransferase family 87 protein [Kiritimatiellia bacterium]
MRVSGQESDAGWNCAWRVWLALTGLVAVSCLAIYLHAGMTGLSALVQSGPLSIVAQTAACVAVSWSAWGIGLALLRSPRIRVEHGVAIACSFVLLLLYVNFLRERIHYADVDDYVKAAFNLRDGTPFHVRYIYPPLLATLCQPFLPLGAHGVAALFWSANLVSLVAFFWLLCAALERYGFGRRLAEGLAFLFLVVNVPVLRTLGYVQINLHVLNLILLAFLLFPRHRIVSALALALAVHLKVSPLLLAVPFICVRDKRWITAFLAGLVGLAGLTSVFYGWAPFASFLANASHIYAANGICFRENSIDSLIRGAGVLAGTDTGALVPYVKVPFLVFFLGCAGYTMRRVTYVERADAGAGVLNGLPAWSAVMVLASPLIWEHHLVFLAIPFFAVAKKMRMPSEWVAYSLAYLLTFLLPTFDFYPWSFGRLFSAAVLMVLMVRSCRAADAEWVARAGQRVDAFFGFGKKGA